MARLRGLSSSLRGLAPTLGALPVEVEDRSRHRDATQEWRRWYKTKRWQRLRWSVLLRDQFTCRMCGRLMQDSSQLHCDHVERHRGDEAKFWAGPFQTLCARCHNSKKQRIERRGGG